MSQSLALYIDKYYIIGAIISDDVVYRVTPSNNEDRFWLYFYEDTASDKIIYGKSYKKAYHSNTPHYHGDIFSQMIDREKTFKRYGRDQELHKIFKASGIVDELKEALHRDAKASIATYLSFSQDISDAARLTFIRDVLEPEDFDVKESVVRIDHLALEHTFRARRYDQDGHYLVLNACNENLHYSVYKHTDNILIREYEGCLEGLGINLTSRALLEQVLNDINKRQLIIIKEEDRKAEYLHLESYVEEWTAKLQAAQPWLPITLTNIRLSKMSDNPYDVILIKSSIEERSKAIIEDIIREIASSVSRLDIPQSDLKGVLFLGNTFENSQFEQALLKRYTFSPEASIHYTDGDLYTIIGVYPQMDCSQFSEATQSSLAQGEDELKRQQLAKEEERRRREAEQSRAEQAEAERKAFETKKNYDEAMNNVADYEKQGEYAQMLDWAKIALELSPDSAEAKKKVEESTRLLSEMKVREEQYKATMMRAQKSFGEGLWSEAIAQAEMALSIKPTSKEANRIKSEASKLLERAEQIDTFFTKAETYLSQKAYKEARMELQKVLALDKNNKRAIDQLSAIGQAIKELHKQIDALKLELERASETGDLDTAISLTNKLIELDTEHQRAWTEQSQHLKAEQKRLAQEAAEWVSLKEQIDKALFGEQWDEVVRLGETALKLREDPLLKSNLDRARQKLETIRQQELYDQGISQVKSYIVDKEWDQANEMLLKLQEQYPEKKESFKKLFNQIFEGEASSVQRSSDKVTRKATSPATTDDFFDMPSSPKRDKPTGKGSTNHPPKPQRETSEDDFFGTASPRTSKKGATLDDFNF
ncbi:MAG: hypothetical protein PUI89_02470 [Bacteroidales bacterium]|nr:hypothetical protein [Bacteroidales bacterium]